MFDVVFIYEYQEKLDGLTTRPVEEGTEGIGSSQWAGQSIRSGIESANRQVRETTSRESGGDVLGGDAQSSAKA
jgi:hypothetical protein